ncbi:DUF3095 domain-containing protein [Rhizobium sp. 0TCS1.26]|uniref:DUF3095 domain-containing protein n=1 Tax=Rhizobium sp. 0TCS1.26 TaxID=3142623 RepID=UPI003D26C0DB
MRTMDDDDFYQSLPVLLRFEELADAASYAPLPSGWVLALADIVGSTQAIALGRYKSVNMAGAGVISAVLNALGTQDYPFVFGGDGAMIAFPGSRTDDVGGALSAVREWAASELDLTMRVALVPIEAVRTNGFDVAIARFGPSQHISYAMFDGGGTSWAEGEMKAGRYHVPEGQASAPDLTGLSCRWSPIPARNGEIVSIIVKPASPQAAPAFQALAAALISVMSEQSRDGHPVPEDGPQVGLMGGGMALETSAAAPTAGARLSKRLVYLLQIGIVYISHRFNLSIGRFDARRYTREIAENSDFRKFDDGLKMTVDVDEPHRQRLEALLEQAERDGICHYGLHRQNSALMTCLVLNPMSHDHMHFIDGASGGYAYAASSIAEKHSGGANRFSMPA